MRCYNCDRFEQYARDCRTSTHEDTRKNVSKCKSLSERGKCNILSIKGIAHDRYVDVVVDTGSANNLISKDIVERNTNFNNNQVKILTAGCHSTLTLGNVQVKVPLGHFKTTINAIVVEKLPKPLILGTKFLQEFNVSISFVDHSIILLNKSDEIIQFKRQSPLLQSVFRHQGG